MTLDFNRCRISNLPLRLFIGEIFGTFLATLFIDASVFNYMANPTASNFGKSFSIGMAICFGIYTCAMIAPMGPINPSVALGFAIGGYVNVKYLPIYYVAELLGAFAAHLCSYGLYHQALHDIGSRLYNNTAFQVPETVFLCTMPQSYTNTATQAFEILIGVSMLVFLNSIIVDARNFNIPISAQPFMVGIVVVFLNLTFSFNTGGPLNLAIDITGRIISSFIGWGSGMWTYGNFYFWIPIVMGQLGAVIGGFTYSLLISPNLPMREEIDAKEDLIEETLEMDSRKPTSNDDPIDLKFIE